MFRGMYWRAPRLQGTRLLTATLRSCVKVEVAVLASLSLIVLMVSVDAKQHRIEQLASELKSSVKVEVAVLGSPPLIIVTVSVDVKQH